MSGEGFTICVKPSRLGKKEPQNTAKHQSALNIKTLLRGGWYRRTVSSVLAISDSAETELLLLCDYVLDVLVLDGDQFFAGDFSFGQEVALLDESLCTEQRAQVLCAERRVLVTGHFILSHGVMSVYLDLHCTDISDMRGVSYTDLC